MSSLATPSVRLLPLPPSAPLASPLTVSGDSPSVSLQPGLVNRLLQRTARTWATEAPGSASASLWSTTAASEPYGTAASPAVQGLIQSVRRTAAADTDARRRSSYDGLATLLAESGPQVAALARTMSGQELGTYAVQFEDIAKLGDIKTALQRIGLDRLDPALKELHQNIVDIQGLSLNATRVSQLTAGESALFSSLGLMANALEIPAPKANGTDVSAYLEDVTAAMHGVGRQVANLGEGFDAIRANVQKLKGMVVDRDTGATMSDKAINWLMNGMPDSASAGGISYRGKSLSLQEASNAAVTDLTRMATSLMNNAARGLDTVSGSARAKRDADLVNQIFQIIGYVATGISAAAGVGGFVAGISGAATTAARAEARGLAEILKSAGESSGKVSESARRAGPSLSGLLAGPSASRDTGGGDALFSDPVAVIRNVLQKLPGGSVSSTTEQALDRMDAAYRLLVTKSLTAHRDPGADELRDAKPMSWQRFEPTRSDPSASGYDGNKFVFDVTGPDGQKQTLTLRELNTLSDGQRQFSLFDAGGTPLGSYANMGSVDMPPGMSAMTVRIPGVGNTLITTLRDGHANLANAVQLA